MMNSGRIWRRADLKICLYGLFGLLALGGLLLMLPERTRLFGLRLIILSISLGLLTSTYLIIINARQGRLLTDSLHPRHGVLSDVAKTGREVATRVLIYAFGFACCLYLALTVTPVADPFVRVFMVLTVALVVWCLGDMTAALAFRRWGATPPPKALLFWLASFGLVTNALGIPASVKFGVWMAATRPGLSTEWIIFVVPCSTMILGAAVWSRDVYVAGWRREVEVERLRAEQADLGRRLAESQLAMLQAQIEPHFLYNTLASVQYLVRKDTAGADFLLTQLIRYLRHAMPKIRQPMSTLGQEFELADAYLQIVRVRMGGRLAVDLELPDALHDTPFPPLVLQTLVENAVKHGVEPKVGPVSIRGRAQIGDDAKLRVSVQDNGVGLGMAPTQGTQAGLANIRERLAGIYGARAQLLLEAVPDGGVLAGVVIPLEAA